MEDLDSIFRTTLESRNKEQRQAIETIDGPVMVVAGPGTGKTDVLGLRAGYILKETDSQPHNILCLTYTDAGAVSMRQRLKRYIGAAAYQVPIYTFHGFCNDVIQNNIQEFGGFRDLQPMDDLERVKLLRTIVEEIPFGHTLHRPSGMSKYYEVDRLRNLFNLMKTENWTSEFVMAQINLYLKELPFNEDYIYKRHSKYGKKGEFKATGIKRKESLETTIAAAGLYNNYLEKCRKLNRYDYADMILWVIEAFTNNELLLLDYQERYQYIMVDEFQDTNGAQMQLIDLLASYWDRPNLFVVGDDDQAIYRFQGADMSNIKRFISSYDPAIIALNKNYRSSERIVEAASHLIKLNGNSRLIPNKEFIAAGPSKNVLNDVLVQEYDSDVEEDAHVTEQLIELYRSGAITDSDSVAVIYKKHTQGEKILAALQAEGIPVELKRKSNVLLDPLGNQVITILRYLDLEIKNPYSGEYYLSQILFYRFFGLHARDIIKIQLESSRRKDDKKSGKIYDLITDITWVDQANFENKQAVLNLGKNLSIWRTKYFETTFQIYFERILSYGSIIEYILKDAERSWKLRVVHTLMEYIKEQSAKDHTYSISRFIQEIDERLEHNISLPIQRILRAGAGVQLMTAHGSKGLEFDYVFIIHATKNAWKKINAGSKEYAMPDTLSTIRDEEGIDDDRRLFYVAMTRARKQLYINYHTTHLDKLQEEVSFITELSDCAYVKRVSPEVDEKFAYTFVTDSWDRWPVDQGIFDKELIHDTLERFSLSVTALNKYLKCPTAFYFENILRVPFARNVYMGFGQAVHYALERWVQLGEWSNRESLLRFFENGMLKFRSHFTDDEYEERLQYGREILAIYHETYSNSMLDPKQYQVEVDIKNVEHRGVPISGKLDLVVHMAKELQVKDYKTGDPGNAKRNKKLNPPKTEDDLGGDYWRQIMYYRILLESDPRYTKPMSSGYMDFVQPDRKSNQLMISKFVPSTKEIEHVSDQIVEVYNNIRAHKFKPGCQEEDCTWCRLINNNMRVKEPLALNDMDEYSG